MGNIPGKIQKGEILMRRYDEGQEKRLEKAVCNGCGRSMRVENGCLKEGCFSADAVFGYFSRKEGTIHHFDLCEDCYDKLISQFQIPVETEENTELL